MTDPSKNSSKNTAILSDWARGEAAAAARFAATPAERAEASRQLSRHHKAAAARAAAGGEA